MEIAEFIKARLAEDEAAAKAALESEWFAHVTEFASANHYDTFGDLAVDNWQWFPGEADGVHVALHNPGRALREVAAKRAILERHQPEPDGILCDGTGDLWPCPEVLAIAAVWSNHPDYNAEWKP